MPVELLKDKNIVQLLSKVSYPFIRAVDKISGEKAAIRVDLQCTDGYNAAAIFSRERLAEAVGTATAAFVLAVLEGSTKPGVWYPEEGGPKRRRLTRVDAGSILTTLFAVSCSASMEDAASLDYGVLGVQVGDIIFYDGKVVHGSTFFRYLGSIIQKDGELDGDVAHRIKTGWLKWKSATGVLCDPDMPHRLKGKFYRTAIRPALLYGTECWAVKRCHVQKMNVAEMRMLRWMCGHTKKDWLRNEVIREKVRVVSIEDKMMENRLRWFGHVRRRPVDAPVMRLESWGTINIFKGRDRPKKTWMKLIENDMRFLGIGESMAMERQIWKERIRVVDEI
ncbi:hypothetical protein OROGR_025298 [Orobanche gracilis]